MKKFIFTLSAIGFLLGGTLSAQRPVGDPLTGPESVIAPRGAPRPVGDALEDRARVFQITGALPVTSVSARPSLTDSILSGFHVLPLESRVGFNSKRPWGFNDGAVWQGRGATFSVSGGVAFKWRRFSAAFRPTLIQNQNSEFDLFPLPPNTGLSPWSYPTGIGQTIDMPQRFGDKGFGTFDWGQSYIRGDFGPVALGVSTENMWWGPGRRNAITMTNQAPGFNHFFLGTSKPASIGIGKLESRWVWGRLRESQYFDGDPNNDSRYFTGIVATLMPKGLPGLELGATRSFVLDWRKGGPSLSEATMIFIPLQKKHFVTPENPAGNDEADQIASVFFRWAAPASGFEIYGEWGKGDHSGDFRDLFVEPEHASGWMLGMQKVFRQSEAGFWRLASEVTILGSARTSTLRAPASYFYVHHLIRQGYTHRGQVLGAGIGPGSSQMFVGVDRFGNWGKAGVGVLRTVYDNNRFYASTDPSYRGHEVEPTLMGDILLYRGRWDLGGSLALSSLFNRFYVPDNDEWNVNLNLTARYHFGVR